MKVLFLDFDGVLNSHKYFSERDNHQPRYAMFDERNEFDPDAMHNLLAILDHFPDLKVVISSSWRYGRTIEKLNELLGFTKVYTDRVIGKTADQSERGYARGWEIQDWLDAHPEVTNFAILDDDSDMVHLSDHHVKTSFSVGLTAENVAQVIKILEAK